MWFGESRVVGCGMMNRDLVLVALDIQRPRPWLRKEFHSVIARGLL